MTVFEFRIFHLDTNGRIADLDEKQFRYVMAETEEEAKAKLGAHCRDLLQKGFAGFVYNAPTVEVENVII